MRRSAYHVLVRPEDGVLTHVFSAGGLLCILLIQGGGAHQAQVKRVLAKEFDVLLANGIGGFTNSGKICSNISGNSVNVFLCLPLVAGYK